MSDEFNEYTVVLKDYDDQPGGATRVVVVASGRHPEGAAGEAECGIAIEVWKRRYPGIDHLSTGELGMDDEWMACMEAVHTLAVIEGTPTVWFEDGIYFPDDDRFVVSRDSTKGTER